MNDQKNENEGGSWVFVLCVSLVATLGGLLFGYDTAVISGAIGFLEQHFELTPTMKGWAASSALLGCVIGAAFAGTLSDRFGRKKMLIIASVFFLVSAVGSAFPRSLTELVIYRILGGIGVGAASMLSPLYIAEISPAHIRGRMVSLNQLSIVSGMLVVYFFNYFIEGHGTALGGGWNITHGWRWMFGSEAIPALALFVLMLLVPETPRWLCKQGRRDSAQRVLERIGGAAHAEAELNEIEMAIAEESGSLKQLFQPKMRLVLFIGISLAVLQQVTGINVFLYYAPEIFKKFGEDSNAALLQTVAIGAANLVFTLIAIYSVDKIGRKPLMIVGSAGMGISLFAIGFGAYFQSIESWALIFILGYIASFALSLGPVVWVVLSEIFPTKIRGRALSIATLCLWSSNFVVSQTFPMMAENEFLVNTFHGGFPFWVYGVFCVITIVFVWRFVPETKGRSLEEIEQMWIEK